MKKALLILVLSLLAVSTTFSVLVQAGESSMAGTPAIHQEEDYWKEMYDQLYEDYKKFTESYGKQDPVYFDFDIQIDTNSTLPMDKQTLANMSIRLAQMQILDPQAVLDVLNWPQREEIIERMNKQQEQSAGQSGNVQQFMQETGTQPPEGGIPPGLGGQ